MSQHRLGHLSRFPGYTLALPSRSTARGKEFISLLPVNLPQKVDGTGLISRQVTPLSAGTP